MVGEQSVKMDLIGVRRMLSADSSDGVVLTPTSMDIHIQAYISLLICCVEELS